MERRLLFAALVAWAAAMIVALVIAAPLHGDEASYALLARGDGPDWAYRSRGVVALARIGLALGASEAAMRASNIVLGFGLVVAVYAVGQSLPARRGAWAAAVIAGAHPFALRGCELLGDVPGAAALVGAVALLLSELSRAGGPRYRLAACAPLLAAAFYLRYGNVLAIGLVLALSLVFWWRSIIRRPGPVVATAALLGALAAPFVVIAHGDPLAVLELGSTIAGRAESYPGAGIVDYLTTNPFATLGIVACPVAAVGAWRARSRPRAYLLAIAAAQVLAIGIVAHGEPRYIFLATALLVALGADAWQPPARVAALVIACTWLATPAMVAYSQSRVPREPIAEGAAIEADAAGRPCMVAAHAIPEIVWYSHCVGKKRHPWDGAPPRAGRHRIIYLADLPGFPLTETERGYGTPIAPGVYRVIVPGQ